MLLIVRYGQLDIPWCIKTAGSDSWVDSSIYFELPGSNKFIDMGL